MLLCTICNEEDLSENLHAASSYHAKRKVINIQHNKNLTEKWEEMALDSDNPSLLALISTENLVANKIFYHSSCYKSMQYKSDKVKRDKSSTDWNAKWKKAEALDLVVSYIIEHEVYVVKNINQKCVEYLSELGNLEQPNTRRFTEKLLLASTNLCSKIINKKSVVLFSSTVSTLVKDILNHRMVFLLHYERLHLIYEENFLSRRTIFQIN